MVSGTRPRGNGNLRRNFFQGKQRDSKPLIRLNSLTFLYLTESLLTAGSRIKRRIVSASWGLRPRRLATRLRRFAPDRLGDPPTRHPPKGIGRRPINYSLRMPPHNHENLNLYRQWAVSTPASVLRGRPGIFGGGTQEPKWAASRLEAGC